MPSGDRASMLALGALGLCSDDDERRQWAKKQLRRLASVSGAREDASTRRTKARRHGRCECSCKCKRPKQPPGSPESDGRLCAACDGAACELTPAPD